MVRQQFLFIFYRTVASTIGENGHSNAQPFRGCSHMDYRGTMVRSTTFADLPPLFPQFVEGVEVLRPISGDSVHRVNHFPDGRISMMLRITQGSPESPDSRDGDICVAGPRRYAFCKTVKTVPLAVVIRFRPASAGLFLGSLPAEDLRDRVIPIEQLWGSEGVRLRKAILRARSSRDAQGSTGCLSKTSTRGPIHLGTDPPTCGGTHTPQSSSSTCRTSGSKTWVTERHLRRAFHTSVWCDTKGLLAHPAASAGVVGFAHRYELGTSGAGRRVLRSGVYDR